MGNDSDRLRQVLDIVCERGAVQSSEIGDALGVSRQTAHSILKALTERGDLLRTGRGRGTRYALEESASRSWSHPTRALREDRLVADLLARDPAFAELPGWADDVLTYALTELVNNVIDHSGADEVTLETNRSGPWVRVTVIDAGDGIFAHVREGLGLPSDLDALQELSKGKTTTAPKEHTGEGLFFTSKVVDRLTIESGELQWIIDNRVDDMAVGVLRPSREGTRIELSLALDQPRDLSATFAAYTEDYAFNRSRTMIKLFEIGVRFVSRSEGKRLVHGLNRFEVVTLDFRDVELVGQGFADQVFRVWARANPGVELRCENMEAPVAFMVERARRGAD